MSLEEEYRRTNRDGLTEAQRDLWDAAFEVCARAIDAGIDTDGMMNVLANVVVRVAESLGVTPLHQVDETVRDVVDLVLATKGGRQ